MEQATNTQPQEVTPERLPLCCPPRDQDPSALHPRVYIALKKAASIGVCPYCGTRFQLQG